MAAETPTDGMVIRESTRFAPGGYVLPRGISVEADGITLDGGGAVLVGAGRQGTGIRMAGHKGVTIQNVRLRDYYHGIHVRDCRGITLQDNQITSTAEVPANSI